MTIDATLNTALNQQEVTLFTAVQIALPTYTINLIDTAGFVTFPVNGVSTTFTGSDPVFGLLSSVGVSGSQMGAETPRCSIILLPPTVEAVGYLSQPEVQMSRVRCYEGAVNPATGAVIGQPTQFWSGIIDVPMAMHDQTARSIELDTVSVLAQFLQKNEGLRLNTAWHQHHFPTATGLRFNVAATETPVWGTEGIYGTGTFGGTVITGGTGGTGGGGSGGSSGGGGGGFGTGRRDIMTNLF